MFIKAQEVALATMVTVHVSVLKFLSYGFFVWLIGGCLL
jgi:hypothetical protein